MIDIRRILLAGAVWVGVVCGVAWPVLGEDLGSVASKTSRISDFDLKGLPALTGGEIGQVSSAEGQKGGGDFIVIGAGERRTIARLEGPGEVERIWVTAKCRDDLFLRKVLLRAYWDGESQPSIDAPLGDFFGVGFGLYKQYTSLVLGMSSGGYYCYFPMPFARSARFEIANEGETPITKFYFQITYRRLESVPAETGYFHAKWRREERTKKGEEYLVLEARGKGKFVGCVLSLQGVAGGQAKFMEGDEKFYIDGAKEASIWGTGIEDYFNSGWYFKEGEFAAPLHGCTVLEKEGNRVSAYRFHISDAIPFEKSLRMTVGHGENNDWEADYSSVAYWYQKERHWEFAPMPGVEGRVPKVSDQGTPPKAMSPEGGWPMAGGEKARGEGRGSLTPPTTASGQGVKGVGPGGPVEGAPPGQAFWQGYYEAGELALPFLACLVGLLGLGYVLRRVMRPGHAPPQ